MKTKRRTRSLLPKTEDKPIELTAQTIVADIVAGLSLEQRHQFALFCCRNDHLREIGLAIAATLADSAPAYEDESDADGVTHWVHEPRPGVLH